MAELAIIGGTGLTQLSELTIIRQEAIETPYGQPSAPFVLGEFKSKQVVFLARHGNPHNLVPHKINYRANLWGLKQLGVTKILAVAAVGGITSEMAPAHIAVPDQIIDYSYGRKQSFFEDDADPVVHVDFSFPYSQSLRLDLIEAGKKAGLKISPVATYGCTQGPRLETAAEIKKMEQDGCDIVGMTGMPEAVLARELGIEYAAIAVIANWAAGKFNGEITMADIEMNLHRGMDDAMKLLETFLV